MSLKSFRIAAVSSVIFVLTTSGAFAYTLNPWSWPKQVGTTYSVNVKYTTSVSTYKTTWSTAVSDWNSAQSKIKFNLSDVNVSSPNTVGTNEDPDGSIYGNTYTSHPNNVLQSFQAYLNTVNIQVTGNSDVRRSTANHELGHALGIADASSVVTLSIMNGDRDRTVVILPQLDDKNAVNNKYPL